MRDVAGCSLGLCLLASACAGGSDLVSSSFADGTEGDSLVSVAQDDTTAAASSVDTSAGTVNESSDASTAGTDAGESSSTGGECGSEELCDGVENDCDEMVDEDCDCTPDDTQDCYSGRAGTAGTGLCATGTQVCSSAGSWGECAGEVTPTEELCNGDDDDCDGASD